MVNKLNATVNKMKSKLSRSARYLWFLIIFFIISFIIIILLARSNDSIETPDEVEAPPPSSYENSQPTTNDYEYGRDAKLNPDRSNFSADNSITESTIIREERSPPPQIVERPSKGNQLMTGSSPLDNCFGNGQYSGKAWIDLINSNNYSDAIVCLTGVGTEIVTRNVYIRAGERYRMNSIPAGVYYIKVCYGNDWNPTKINFCGTSGAFGSNVSYSKSDKIPDWIDIIDSNFSNTSGLIFLYTEGGNMSKTQSSVYEFFSR